MRYRYVISDVFSSDLLFFKQKTAYKMRISDWSSDVCSSDLLGSGVIGVSTAYYLAKAGHEVLVLDRQPAAGLETSFANAGEVSLGYYAPCAGPGMPLQAIKWMLQKRAPLVIRPRIDIYMMRWRSEDTSGGNICSSTCIYRSSPYTTTKKKQ